MNRDLIAGSMPPLAGLVLIPTSKVARCLLSATVGATRQMTQDGDGEQPGDPAKAAAAIIAAIDAPQAPLRLPLGDDAVDAITGHLDSVRAELAAWEKTARDTRLDG